MTSFLYNHEVELALYIEEAIIEHTMLWWLYTTYIRIQVVESVFEGAFVTSIATKLNVINVPLISCVTK